ncbi:MAG: type VII toxin-antitoxin system HepT family RNase toxin [Steroidobacteraceae bacterium]
MSTVAKKIATIVRCVDRAREEYAGAAGSFRTDHSRQDAAILNVMRACEAAVDLANMLVRKRRLGLPSDMKESFALLERGGLIPAQLCERMQKMIGFRNIAVHDYHALNLDIVEAVIGKHLGELLTFAEAVRPHLTDEN